MKITKLRNKPSASTARPSASGNVPVSSAWPSASGLCQNKGLVSRPRMRVVIPMDRVVTKKVTGPVAFPSIKAGGSRAVVSENDSAAKA